MGHPDIAGAAICSAMLSNKSKQLFVNVKLKKKESMPTTGIIFYFSNFHHMNKYCKYRNCKTQTSITQKLDFWGH